METQATDNAVTTNAAPTQPAQNPTDGANSGQSNGAKTFTQEQVNEMVGSTRKSARDTAIADMLKELGLTSKEEISSLKSTIEEARKRKEADMTEADKAKAELEREKKAKDDALAQLNAERAERRNDRIASHLLAEAGKMKATDAETVLLYARDKHKAELDAIMSEDGALDESKTKKLLETIKTAKPVYFQAVIQGAGVPSNAGGRAMLSDSKLREQGTQDIKRHIKANF